MTNTRITVEIVGDHKLVAPGDLLTLRVVRRTGHGWQGEPYAVTYKAVDAREAAKQPDAERIAALEARIAEIERRMGSMDLGAAIDVAKIADAIAEAAANVRIVIGGAEQFTAPLDRRPS